MHRSEARSNAEMRTDTEARTDDANGNFLVGEAPESDVKQGSGIRGFMVALPIALVLWGIVIVTIVRN